MKKQKYNNLDLAVNRFTAERYWRKKALVSLLLLNAAASSDMAHGEGNGILLSKAAGDGNEL